MRLTTSVLVLINLLLFLPKSYAVDVSASDDNSVNLSGSIMYDVDSYTGAIYDEQRSTDSELRRAKFTLASKFNKQWDAKLGINIDGEGKSVSLTDAYIKYSSPLDFSLSFGQTKEPFGLENSTSSKYISTIERSMVTSAFAPGRNYGVLLESSNKYYSVGLGIYEANVDKDDNKTFGGSMRLTTSLINNESTLLHIGINAGFHDWGGDTYKIKETAEVHLADKIVESQKFKADKIGIVGLELALVYTTLSIQAEAYYQEIKEVDNVVLKNESNEGYYVQMAYFLTKDRRKYSKGAFKRIVPRDRYGAWEAVARLSKLDTIDNASETGVETENAMFGVNYYANEKVRFMVNFSRATMKGPDALVIPEGEFIQKAVSFRVQYDF